MKTERRNQFVDAVCKLVDATIAAQCEVPGPGNDALVREMHTVDCAPRNVIVPLLSVLAVPVVRPEPSWNPRGSAVAQVRQAARHRRGHHLLAGETEPVAHATSTYSIPPGDWDGIIEPQQ